MTTIFYFFVKKEVCLIHEYTYNDQQSLTTVAPKTLKIYLELYK